MFIRQFIHVKTSEKKCTPKLYQKNVQKCLLRQVLVIVDPAFFHIFEFEGRNRDREISSCRLQLDWRCSKLDSDIGGGFWEGRTVLEQKEEQQNAECFLCVTYVLGQNRSTIILGAFAMYAVRAVLLNLCVELWERLAYNGKMVGVLPVEYKEG